RSHVKSGRKGRRWLFQTRPGLELLEDRRLLSIFTVSNTNDSGAGSLRQAILDANTAATGTPTAPDLIQFAILASGVQTIAPISPLPPITDPVTIDGYTQSGSSPNQLGIGPNTPGHQLGDGDNAVLLIQLLGSNAGANASGLDVIADGTAI